MNNFSRATSAFVLTASLLASSVAVAAQTTTPKPAGGQKTTEAKAESKPAEQKTVVTPAKSNKPLSTNEDPAMIGKRKINRTAYIFDNVFAD